MRKRLRTSFSAVPIQEKTRLNSRVLQANAEKTEAREAYSFPTKLTGKTCSTSHAGAYASALNRATASQASRGGQSLLQLQRQYGNRYVQRVLAQARKGKEEASASPEAEQAIQQARGGGQALDSGVRAQMEPALGADFSGVRVHANAQADTLNRALNARAFTTGQDIFFRQGAYTPGSSSGRELLAHELTHVVQQAGGARPKLTVGQPGDRYEQEADQVARAVMQREQQPIRKDTDEGLVQRQVEEEEEEEEEEELVQTKADKAEGQRQMEEEEEPIQAKAEDAWVQRQMEEEEEEPIQTKVEDVQVQRQSEEEEEEPVQIKTEDSWVQRQAEEEEEEPIQAKTAVRRSPGPGKLLTRKQVESAMRWYMSPKGGGVAPNTSDAVIGQIQEKVGTNPDGIVGPHTIQAVARWQKKHRLYVDGKAGRKTLIAMFGKDIRPSAELKGQVEGATKEPGKPGKPSITKKKGVIVTPGIQNILDELEGYFRQAGLRVWVTSAVRTPERQLRIIVRKAKQYGLHKKYPLILNATVDDVESWRSAWDELLNVKGFIVNPPKRARCKLGKRAGKYIWPSPHTRKKAFDLAGAPLDSIKATIKSYKKDGGPIKQILVETVNNCVHIGIN